MRRWRRFPVARQRDPVDAIRARSRKSRWRHRRVVLRLRCLHPSVLLMVRPHSHPHRHRTRILLLLPFAVIAAALVVVATPSPTKKRPEHRVRLAAAPSKACFRACETSVECKGKRWWDEVDEGHWHACNKEIRMNISKTVFDDLKSMRNRKERMVEREKDRKTCNTPICAYSFNGSARYVELGMTVLVKGATKCSPGIGAVV